MDDVYQCIGQSEWNKFDAESCQAFCGSLQIAPSEDCWRLVGKGNYRDNLAKESIDWFEKSGTKLKESCTTIKYPGLNNY